jgi:hypothetical protein
MKIASVATIHDLHDMQCLNMHQDAVGVQVSVAKYVFLLARFSFLGRPVSPRVVVHHPQGWNHNAVQASCIRAKRVELCEHLVLDKPAGVGPGYTRTLLAFPIGVLVASWHSASVANKVERDGAICSLSFDPGYALGVLLTANELRNRNGGSLCDLLDGGSVVKDPFFCCTVVRLPRPVYPLPRVSR